MDVKGKAAIVTGPGTSVGRATSLTLARTCGPDVRVDAVAPGFIDGEWLWGGLGDACENVRSAMEARPSIGRVATPESVAPAILSLITGSDVLAGHGLPAEGGTIIGQG